VQYQEQETHKEMVLFFRVLCTRQQTKE